jgi:putative transposase
MDKTVDIENSGLSYGRGYVYDIKYHFVWCVKYRRQVLTGQIASECENIIRETSAYLNAAIQAVEIMPDHIHLLLAASPQLYIPNVIRIMKGNTARKLFAKFPELKSKLWDEHLWNPSYFVATVSDRTQEQISHYINTQKQRV